MTGRGDNSTLAHPAEIPRMMGVVGMVMSCEDCGGVTWSLRSDENPTSWVCNLGTSDFGHKAAPPPFNFWGEIACSAASDDSDVKGWGLQESFKASNVACAPHI